MANWINVDLAKPRRQHWTECGSVWVKVKIYGKRSKDILQYDHSAGRWRDTELYHVYGVTHWAYFGE